MNYARAMIAGLIATLVLSAIMLMKSAMGLMPELNVIAMVSGMANNYLGLPQSPATGWAIHFFVGIFLYGFAFAAFYQALPGRNETVKGISLSVVAWLIMMVVLMPMAGQGFFGLGIGIMAPIMTLVLHVIFGAVLGYSDALLKRQQGIAHQRERTA